MHSHTSIHVNPVAPQSLTCPSSAIWRSGPRRSPPPSSRLAAGAGGGSLGFCFLLLLLVLLLVRLLGLVIQPIHPLVVPITGILSIDLQVSYKSTGVHGFTSAQVHKYTSSQVDKHTPHMSTCKCHPSIGTKTTAAALLLSRRWGQWRRRCHWHSSWPWGDRSCNGLRRNLGQVGRHRR